MRTTTPPAEVSSSARARFTLGGLAVVEVGASFDELTDDRIAMLYDGRVRTVGTVDEIQHTTDPVVRQFIEGRAELDPQAA